MDRFVLRRKVRRARRRVRHYGWSKLLAKPAHDLRWRLSEPESLARWAERRLRLDGWYWLFVLGLNNSGTSILSTLLAAHPNVRSLPNEGQLLSPAFPRAPQHGVGRVWTQRLDVFRWTEESDSAPALRALYDWAWFYEPGSGILLEKSPPDAIRSRWLQANFRPSRFIALTRHPYAVCEGIRRRTGLPIADAAAHWRRGNELLLEDCEHLEHCLMLTYEDLVERPDEQLTRVERFLGLDIPIDRRLLDVPIPMHNIGGRPQVLQNLNAKSVERLAREDVEAIDRIAGPLMDRLAYERSAPAAQRSA